MLAKVIAEWLTEYKSLADEEVHTFACTVRENKPLVDSLYALFESRPSIEELDPVCHQLFEFYRSKEPSLRKFALEFIPTLILLYLRCLSLNDKKACSGLEAFLLGVYNLEIVQSDGTPKVKTFRIPSVTQTSIYHDPASVNPRILTESALSRYNRTEEEWKGGPYPHYENINGQNRQAVLSQLIQTYNADIAVLANHSHRALCTAASRICGTGLPSLNVSPTELQSWPATNGPRPNRSSLSQRQQPRMSVSPALLVEMLWGINYAMFNGCSKVAKQAVQDVHARASYELLADVLLVTEAILNSDRLGMGPTDNNVPMGIPTSISPHTSVKRATITNASFKTKKLPDDISVDPAQIEAESSTARLSPIEEESKGLGKHALRTSKGRKDKDKDKPHSKESRKDSDAGSNKSLVINGDAGIDPIPLTVSDADRNPGIELKNVRRTGPGSKSGEKQTTNGNNSSDLRAREKMGGSGEGQGVLEVKSRPTSLNGAQINPESYSTDL